MADISAGMVKELRDRTGAGFMDCKGALVAADGDMDRAVGLLREKGLAAAARKSSREALEGLISSYIHTGGRVGVLIEVNCETDFVARTEEFRTFAEKIADEIAAHDAFGETRSNTAEAILALPAPGHATERVSDAAAHLVAKLKENITIRRFTRLTPRAGEKFASYVHGHGRIGVLIGMTAGDDALGKDVAMHVAAADPRFASRGEVTPAMLETEREIARAQAVQAGKPPNVVERIAQGKVEKFYQETVLTEQAFVKDPEKTVGQVLVERGGKPALELRFARFKMGENLSSPEARQDAEAKAGASA